MDTTATNGGKTTFPVALVPHGDLAYRAGFLDAGDRLVATMVGEPFSPPLLYPVCYLYRHGLELELKELIRDVQRALRLMEGEGTRGQERVQKAAKLRQQSEAEMGRHNLLQLFNLGVAYLRLLGYEELPAIVRATIVKLHEVDPTGEAFRYGRFKDGTPTLGETWHLDLLQLQANVREAQRHLNMAGNYAVITGDQILEFRDDMDGE